MNTFALSVERAGVVVKLGVFLGKTGKLVVQVKPVGVQRAVKELDAAGVLICDGSQSDAQQRGQASARACQQQRAVRRDSRHIAAFAQRPLHAHARADLRPLARPSAEPAAGQDANVEGNRAVFIGWGSGGVATQRAVFKHQVEELSREEIQWTVQLQGHRKHALA